MISKGIERWGEMSMLAGSTRRVAFPNLPPASAAYRYMPTNPPDSSLAACICSIRWRAFSRSPASM
jgi:hypothetical protein